MGRDDHIADIDPDPEQDALIRGIVAYGFVDAVLEQHRRPYRIDGAGEFRQQSVAGVLDDAAAVTGDRRRNGVCQQRHHARMRPLFVCVHQTRIAGDVGHENRGQPPFDTLAGKAALAIRIIHPSISNSSP
jgi:hypothetical protein